MAQDRATFQQLAEERLAEATLLLAQGYPSGAYYLAGYAVECALKASIATRFKADEIPDKSLVNSVYTHKLIELLRLSGLEHEVKADKTLSGSWTVASEWSEQARYRAWTTDEASAMLNAISGNEGLLKWLLNRL
ncbi:MAG: HEPN domain-containing protein [Tardiphaga sp.]|nr:HEPN domain-containing protein [Tardiphaga sp.]